MRSREERLPPVYVPATADKKPRLRRGGGRASSIRGGNPAPLAVSITQKQNSAAVNIAVSEYQLIRTRAESLTQSG